MIISFNPQIFQITNENLQRDIAFILVYLFENYHFLDISDLENVFFEDDKFIFKENEIATQFLSKKSLIELEDFIFSIIGSSTYVTQLHKKHLSKIRVGNKENDITPNDTRRILLERAKVIVENGINDWNFIKGLVDKYESHKQRGVIYRLIKKAIRSDKLESENAGGIGEIRKIAKELINGRYKDIQTLKLMTIFDSDRDSATDFTKHKDEIAFFKNKEKQSVKNDDYNYSDGDIIIWHILYKKKMENYLPLSVLLQELPAITIAQKTSLEGKTPDELDYIVYDSTSIGLGKGQIKNGFPTFFQKNFSYRDLETRCEHHLVWSDETQSEITEIEQLLLKIAKII